MRRIARLLGMPLLGLLFLGMVVVACGGETRAPATVIDREAVTREVGMLFEALERSDCEALRARMPTLTSDERCRDFLHDAEEHGLALIEVVEVVPDGRDARSAMVRTGVRQGGHPRQILIRATNEGGRWTFAM